MADSILLICFVNHIFAAHQVYGFIVHTSLQNLVFNTLDDTVPDDIHSEYYFGKCSKRNKTLKFKETKTYDDIKGKLVITGIFDMGTTEKMGIPALPRCVYLRARSKYTDIVRYHAFTFNICLGNLIFQYVNKIYNFPYYEWYLPADPKEGITWELYFYA